MIYDKDIREPLFDFLEEKYGKSRVIEEKKMGRSRADVMLITADALIGIEIKSDADTYVRLASQVKDYELYYDYNLVVVGSSHASHVAEHVPEHWGIISVEAEDDALDFYVVREAEKNPNITWEKKLLHLWRPEIVQLQAWNDMPKYDYLSKAKVIDKIVEWMEKGKLDEAQVQRQMCNLLFERDYTAIHDTINAYREAHGQKKRRRRIKRGRKKL